jgi:peptide/nickel transport system ATP-binding protein
LNRLPPHTADAILDVTRLTLNLSTRWRTVNILDNITFSLQKGRTLAVVGESGCGKSMLCRAILAIHPAKARRPPPSSVRFDGQELIGMRERGLSRLRGRRLSMVFQNPTGSLNPVLTIGRQITETLRRHLGLDAAAARRRAAELLVSVGFPDPARRLRLYPHQLSGGQRQRAALAIALSCGPDLLVADEPTTALDVTVQAEILNLLARHQKKRKMAMILVTHDLSLTAGRADDIVVMYAGRIVERGKTADIFSNVKMPYTFGLMQSIPRLNSTGRRPLQTIEGQPPAPGDRTPGCRFAPRCPRAETVCLEKTPELVPVDGNDHWAACWYPLQS